MEVNGQLHAPAALAPGKEPLVPLDRRLGGPQSRYERGGEEKNSQPPPGIEPYNPDLPARSPALYGLSYHGSQATQRLQKLFLRLKTPNVWQGKKGALAEKPVLIESLQQKSKLYCSVIQSRPQSKKKNGTTWKRKRT
jgi:hypothetical protein